MATEDLYGLTFYSSQRLLESHRRHLDAIAEGPVIEVARPPNEGVLDLSDDRLADLNAMSGIDSYRGEERDGGIDLMRSKQAGTVRLSLRTAIRQAIEKQLNKVESSPLKTSMFRLHDFGNAKCAWS